MNKTIVLQNQNYKLVKYTNTVKFHGCQCFKDCSCKEDFIPWTEEWYRIVPTDPNKGRGEKYTKYETALKAYNKKIMI